MHSGEVDRGPSCRTGSGTRAGSGRKGVYVVDGTKVGKPSGGGKVPLVQKVASVPWWNAVIKVTGRHQGEGASSRWSDVSKVE